MKLITHIISLLAERISDISKMSNALNIHALRAELKINIGKTKLLRLPASERDRSQSVMKRSIMSNLSLISAVRWYNEGY